MSRSLVAAGLLLATVAQARDVPVAGARLDLRAARRPSARGARLVLRDPGIAPPFADPRAEPAMLLLNAGAGAGQCAVAVTLDAGSWRPLGRNGAARGYRSRRPPARATGIRRVSIEPGRITVDAGGRRWPCDLAAPARLPVSAVLAVGDDRYCGAFGGVQTNRAGRLAARDAPAPAACPSTRLTVADLNILHGSACPGTTNGCRRSERVSLLFDWLQASGCPDVVTLQEVSSVGAPLIAGHLGACAYTAVYTASNALDDEMILTRYPAVVVEETKLRNNFRSVLFARLDHPLGPVDVFTTHLASGSDGAEAACGATCPAECVQAGATTVRQCQAVQMARLIAARHDPTAPAVVTGDFNESPGSFVYRQFVDRGWADVFVAAGHAECNPATGAGCTSGRVDDALVQLESPVSNEVERIDFVFLVAPGARHCAVDPAHTRLFAGDPNPFAPACGAAPAPICWPSDHEGVQAAVDCR